MYIINYKKNYNNNLFIHSFSFPPMGRANSAHLLHHLHLSQPFALSYDSVHLCND